MDSIIAGRQFEPDSDFSSIFFLNYNVRACSVNLHLAELTRLGEPKCIQSKKFSRMKGYPTFESEWPG